MSATPRCLIAHDNLDDRRELHQLLHRLRPRLRIAFLDHCCRLSTLPNHTTHPEVGARTRRLAVQAERSEEHSRKLSLDVFYDLWALSIQYRLDLDRVLDQLVELVRQQK